MKNFKNDIRKMQIRGSIKEIMKTRGLRSINFANYNRWKEDDPNAKSWLHSIKFNIEDGYIQMFAYNENVNAPQAGPCYADISMDMYESAMAQVASIIEDEVRIPSKIKRNILVKMSR